MKKHFLVLGSFLLGNFCMAQPWTYGNEFGIDYKLEDYGLRGKVERSVETFSHYNEEDKLVKGDDGWYSIHKMIHHFNEQGALTSRYRVDVDGDTTEIVHCTYDDKHRLISAKVYEPDFLRKGNSPSDLSLWDLVERTYQYADERLSKVTLVKHSIGSPLTSELDFTYDAMGRIATTASTAHTKENGVPVLQTFSYVGTTGMLSEIRIQGSFIEQQNGVLTYRYDDDLKLTEKVFTPDAVKKKQEWLSEESFWKYDAEGNQTQVVVGDSAKWPVYIYDSFEYNEHHDEVSHDYIAEYDGQGRSKIKTTYAYDAHQNWVFKTISAREVKMYPSGEPAQNPNKVYSNQRTIRYFAD